MYEYIQEEERSRAEQTAPSFPPLVSSSPFFRIFASRALFASAAAGARFEIAASFSAFLPSFLPLLSFAPRANSAKVVTICIARVDTRTRTKTETETLYDITGQRQIADRNKTSLGRLEMSDYSFAHYHSLIPSFGGAAAAETLRVSSTIRSSSSSPFRNECWGPTG